MAFKTKQNTEQLMAIVMAKAKCGLFINLNWQKQTALKILN